MIKVVEAISDMNIGGAGILLLNRIKHTDKRKFNTIVVVPYGSLLCKRLKNIGVPVIEIKGCQDSSFDLRGICAYIYVLKKIKPDIINSHGCLASRIAAWIVGVPIKIYTRHCVYPVKYKSAVIRFVVGVVTDILTDRVIAVAYSAKENLMQMGIRKEKISVIINGAEALKSFDREEKSKIRRKLGILPNEKVVSICARLEPCKDHRCFLEAARVLNGYSDKYRFLIIGDGNLDKSLRELTKVLGLEKKVIFTGFVEDVSPLLNISDVNVNCSVGTETSSLALSEGMSAGIPAVVSDYGGNPYMIRDGENGYIYKTGDYKALAKNILRITEASEEEYSKLSYRSRLRFNKEFNSEKMAENTQTLYLKLYTKKNKSNTTVCVTHFE